MTIPTPYIGGAGGQQADRPDKKEMAPPFFTEDETAEAETPPEAEPKPQEAADALADLDLAEEFEIEPALPEEEPEELAPAEPIEEISELALDPSAAPGEEPFATGPGAAEPEPKQEAEATLESTSAPDGPGFGIDDSGFPDFLEGPDDAAPDAPASTPGDSEEAPAPSAEEPAGIEPPFEKVEAPFNVDEITAMAARLMTGEYSDWIMQLKDDLGPTADETAILGAFAAGYLAGLADMEKD